MYKVLLLGLLLQSSFAFSQCKSEFVKENIEDEEDVYLVQLPSLEDKEVTCIDDWLLLGDFGREVSTQKAIMGSLLSHENKLVSHGWKVSTGVKFFDINLNAPSDRIRFYSTGEVDGEISVALPSGISMLKMIVLQQPQLVNNFNAIYFRGEDGDMLLWEESSDRKSQRVVLDDLDKYGVGEIVFIEKSGFFEVDKVWVK